MVRQDQNADHGEGGAQQVAETALAYDAGENQMDRAQREPDP